MEEPRRKDIANGGNRESKHIRKCGTQSGQNDEMTSNSMLQKCRKGSEPTA